MSQGLVPHLRALREQGQLTQAQALIRAAAVACPQDPALTEWAWLHEPFWWEPLQGRRVTLRRRGPADAAFVRECWAAPDFLARFHRYAAPLPADDTALATYLQREQAALPAESQALHWTVHDAKGPMGLVSVVEWSMAQGRAEFLIGFPSPPPNGAALEAALLAVDFLHRKARVEKLSASVYAENTAAWDLALRFGFEAEGRLRGHFRLADGQRADLLLAGLLLDAHGRARLQRWRRRQA